MVSKFVGPMRAEVGRAIYVWGRVGEIVTSASWIRAYETTSGNAQRAIDLWEERKAAGVDPIRAFDCSGFIVWMLRILGLTTVRYTADMFSNICPTIPKADLRVGDFVFNLDSDGNAFHVGIVSKIEFGVTYVVEARGRDYGVVERPISLGAWDDWSHNPFIDTSREDDMIYCKYGDGRETATSSDPAVRSMQEGLVRLGQEMINDGKTYPPDGRYGTATVNGVAAYKLANNLPGDGQTVDNACLTVMLAQLAALESGIPQSDVDKLTADLKAATDRATFLVSEVAEGQKIIRDQKVVIADLNADVVAAKAKQVAAENAAQLQREKYAEQDALIAAAKQGKAATDRLLS